MELHDAVPLLVAGTLVTAVAVLQLLLPDWMGPGTLFARSSAPSLRQAPEGRALVRRYRWHVLLATVVTLLLALGARRFAGHALTSLAVTLQVLLGTLAFLHARSRMRAHAVPASSVREASLRVRREGLPGGLLVQAGPLLLLGGRALWLGVNWQSLPERWPSHWGVHGQPNAWTERSVQALGGQLLTGALLCLALLALGLGLHRGARAERTAQGGRSRREAALTSLLLAEYFLALLFTMTTVPVQSPLLPVLVVVGGALAVAVASVVLLVRSQPARGLPDDGAAAFAAGDGTPEKAWWGGLVYANRADPALFVPKRFGLGYTLNFGHPLGPVVVLLLLAVMTLVYSQR